MAKKISELEPAGEVTGTELVPIVQGGQNKLASLEELVWPLGGAAAAQVAADADAAAASAEAAAEAEAGAAGALTARIGSMIVVSFDHAIYSHAFAAENGLIFAYLRRSDGRLRAAFTEDSVFPPSLVGDALGQFSPYLANGGVSGPDICCVGDSLTAQGYPAMLAGLIGRTVHNLGVGGETSRTITGRMVGWPILVSPAGGAIPADGAVQVTLSTPDGGAVAPLLQHGADGRGVNPCTVAGVQGTLSLASGIYSFTRSVNGAAVPIPFPRPLITSAWTQRRGDILILEQGQNGGYDTMDTLLAQDAAIIGELNRPVNLWLRLGFSTGTDASQAANDATFLKKYGVRYVNHRKYLSSYAALTHAGIAPTPTDDADIAEGRVPTSLRSDATHLNAAGQAEKAFYVAQRLLDLGWI